MQGPAQQRDSFADLPLLRHAGISQRGAFFLARRFPLGFERHFQYPYLPFDYLVSYARARNRFAGTGGSE